MKVAHVIHSNSVAVQMASQFHRVHSTMVAIAHNQNSNVALMKLLLLKDQTLRDVHALQANTVVVQMEILKRKAATSMDVKTFQRHRRNRAVFQKMAAPVATSPLRTSSMLNMEHALDSGTVDVAVTIIDSKLSKIARVRANRPKEKVLVCYQKFMALVPVIIHHSITILIVICVHNSFTEVAWVTIIDSKQWKLARDFALLIEPYVSI